MEQKKSERAARGVDAWQPQARQQQLDEADRFQVMGLWLLPLNECKQRRNEDRGKCLQISARTAHSLCKKKNPGAHHLKPFFFCLSSQ